MLLLIGCNKDQMIGFDKTIKTDMKQLSRVDVQQINSDGSFGDVTTIGDKDSVDLLILKTEVLQRHILAYTVALRISIFRQKFIHFIPSKILK